MSLLKKIGLIVMAIGIILLLIGILIFVMTENGNGFWIIICSIFVNAVAVNMLIHKSGKS